VFLTVKAVMSRMDASLEDASLICGAGVGRTIWHVLIPLSLPAILSAGILVLTRALEEFAIPGVIGTPSGIYTVTTYIYYQAVSYIPPRYEVAASLATALMGIIAFCLGLQAWLLGGKQRFTTISGKGHPARLTRLGRWRYAALAYALAYIALTVVLPFLVLIYAAFITQWGRPPTLAVLPVRQGLANSLLLGFTGATAAALLTLIVGYIITGARSFASHTLDFVSAIPLAMPGPVMAVAVLWAYLNPPFVLYGTLWILLVAYVTHYLPYGVRTVTGSFRQISIEFERAAAVCGAGRVTGFRISRHSVPAGPPRRARGVAADVRVDDPRVVLVDLPLRARQRNRRGDDAGDVAGGAVFQRRRSRAVPGRHRPDRRNSGEASVGKCLLGRRLIRIRADFARVESGRIPNCLSMSGLRR
jgi:iron(III) transport system permease protein